MCLYIDNGVWIVWMDVVVFVWKELGIFCIYLLQIYVIVWLFCLLFDYVIELMILLMEINVLNCENISYFGNWNEVYVVYNFLLLLLILQVFLLGLVKYLNVW